MSLSRLLRREWCVRVCWQVSLLALQQEGECLPQERAGLAAPHPLLPTHAVPVRLREAPPTHTPALCSWGLNLPLSCQSRDALASARFLWGWWFGLAESPWLSLRDGAFDAGNVLHKTKRHAPLVATCAQATGSKKKIRSRFSFPNTLDMAPFLPKSAPTTAGETRTKTLLRSEPRSLR